VAGRVPRELTANIGHLGWVVSHTTVPQDFFSWASGAERNCLFFIRDSVATRPIALHGLGFSANQGAAELTRHRGLYPLLYKIRRPRLVRGGSVPALGGVPLQVCLPPASMKAWQRRDHPVCAITAGNTAN
jgi:hypothetical protein